MKRRRVLFSLGLALLLSACERPAPAALKYTRQPAGDGAPVYTFAVHPLHNPHRLSEIYQPLVDHLNRSLSGMRVELEAARDYRTYEQRLRNREPAFLLPNPWQALKAIDAGYDVIAMAGDAVDFKGVFIVRRDSGIRVPHDLRGKVVSYPAPTALAAAVMPQYFLHTHGIDVNRDIENVYVGSQESSIMNVYLGKSSAGATWPLPWRLFQRDHPTEAAALALIWETPSLVNNAVMAREDVPAAVREQVRQALLDLGNTPGGTEILRRMEMAAFHAADNASYDGVREYIARFEREVRPVERE